ncbi:MAG: PilZ domain-containing protein [Thermodesulfobacteriota bacterium]|nr:PilZ domain-containing protein [Thermodesulfobacteriota bacterium]
MLHPKRFERRRHPRINITLDARFIIVSKCIDRDFSSGVIQGKTISVSTRGVSLKTNTVQINGLHIASSVSVSGKNTIQLELDLPSCSKTINAEAEVRWYDLTPEDNDFLYNVGLSFTNLNEENSEALKRFIMKEKRKEEKPRLAFIRKWFFRK